MKKICAWCQKVLSVKTMIVPAEKTPISHGMCADCLRKVLAFESQTVTEFLNQFTHPVLLLNAKLEVLTANKAGRSLFQREDRVIEGLPGGNVFLCKYAETEEGCGNTTHCKGCTIRNSVTETYKTGNGHTRVAAYQDLHLITGERKVKFLISTEKVGDSVLLRIDEIED